MSTTVEHVDAAWGRNYERFRNRLLAAMCSSQPHESIRGRSRNESQLANKHRNLRFHGFAAKGRIHSPTYRGGKRMVSSSRPMSDRFVYLRSLSISCVLLVAGVGLYASWDGSQDPATAVDRANDRAGWTSPDDDDQASDMWHPESPIVWGGPPLIGLERRVEIRLTSDRISMGPADDAISFDEGTSLDATVDLIGSGLHRIIGKWGAPPPKFYWLPTLRFVVQPAGVNAYERIRGAVERKCDVTSMTTFIRGETTSDDALSQ
jgi:hypothetical protein